MRRLLMVLLMMSTLLSACASYPDLRGQRLESLPQHYKQFDLVMGWEVKPTDRGAVVQGVVKNLRYFVMRGLEIWVVRLDHNGKELSRSVTFIIPNDLGLDESADFTVKLPAPVTAGDRLRFTYNYFGIEGGGDEAGQGIKWMQSFETVVP